MKRQVFIIFQKLKIDTVGNREKKFNCFISEFLIFHIYISSEETQCFPGTFL